MSLGWYLTTQSDVETLTDDSRIIIYDRNMFIVEATRFAEICHLCIESQVVVRSKDFSEFGPAVNS